jgi:hypothetical protein
MKKSPWSNMISADSIAKLPGPAFTLIHVLSALFGNSLREGLIRR